MKLMRGSWTSRKNYEALINSEKRFELLLTSISDYAIYLLYPDGQIVIWNACAQRFKGYTSEEFVEQHFSRFLTLEDRYKGMPQNILNQAAINGRFEVKAGVFVRWNLFLAPHHVDAIYNQEKV